MLRFATYGALFGAAMGTAFALAVISIADCAGPGCAGERALGLAGHAAGGAVVGGLLGLLARGVRKLVLRSGARGDAGPDE